MSRHLDSLEANMALEARRQRWRSDALEMARAEDLPISVQLEVITAADNAWANGCPLPDLADLLPPPVVPRRKS